MTTHTGTAAAASTAKPGLPTSTPVFWSLIAVTVTITILLTGWTAAQAVVINDAVNGNGPSHPSIRQLERPAQGDDQHYSIRQLERAAETERQAPQHPSIRQIERATSVTVEPPRFVSIRQVERAEHERSDQLRQLEAAETQRFTNRADVTGELPPSTIRPTRRELQYLEYTELRRFRNRAPSSALPALDAEIQRLRMELR